LNRKNRAEAKELEAAEKKKIVEAKTIKKRLQLKSAKLRKTRF
jgi:hypothetical protein